MDSVKPGDILAGRYVVERVVGRGGSGTVVAATDIALRRLVALKFLRQDVAEHPEAVQRFLREAQICAQIQSEHVARVMDTGTLESGVPYIVMEYLEGRDLAALLSERGALHASEAVEFLMQACEALAEAHALGIVHRDLKPSNLFLTVARDGSPLLKVLDFGLSKIRDGLTSEVLTANNIALGSPHFIPPEQLRSSRDVDARSDIWALGAVLFTLLAGRTPFRGKLFMDVGLAILEGAIPQLRSLRSDIPPKLEEIVVRCLRVAPEERFASVAELATALVPFAPAHGPPRAMRVARIVARTPETAAFRSAFRPDAQRGSLELRPS